MELLSRSLRGPLYRRKGSSWVARFHTAALRGTVLKNCSALPHRPYEKLFPEPQAQVSKKCAAAGIVIIRL